MLASVQTLAGSKAAMLISRGQRLDKPIVYASQGTQHSRGSFLTCAEGLSIIIQDRHNLLFTPALRPCTDNQSCAWLACLGWHSTWCQTSII